MPSQFYFNKLFTLYAPAYPIISALFNQSRKKVISSLEEKLSTIEKPKVLLVGAGDGIDIPFFKSSTQLTYLDASKGMFKKASKKFRSRANVSFILSDFLEYESTDKFDVVCFHFCLSVTSQPSNVIEKASSFLISNGYLSIIDISEPRTNMLSRGLNTITKFSMFNLKLNISELISRSKSKFALKEKSYLKESKLFASFLYLKDSNE